MASATKQVQTRRAARDGKMGRKRKNKMARKSTLSYEELFAGLPPVKNPTKK